jgi:hypothetical protein
MSGVCCISQNVIVSVAGPSLAESGITNTAMSNPTGTPAGANPTTTHVLGAIAAISNAEWNAMDPELAILAQDANGDATYSNERAAVGHLESKYHMLIDAKTDSLFTSANEIKVSLKTLGEKNGIISYLAGGDKRAAHVASHSYLAIYSTQAEADDRKLTTTRLTALNFAQLREAGLGVSEAFLCAALRARWIITGAYGVAKFDTSAAYSEVKVVTDTNAIFGRIVAATNSREIINALGKYAPEFVKAYGDENSGMRWATKHAENIWAAVEHCFRVRSHHFKDQREMVDSYSSLYLRFLEASYEGEFEWPRDVSMISVFRIAIHPFKMIALPVMTAHYVAHGKVANAAITRMSGSPCGLAQITTAVAALDTMRAEAWWPAFESSYRDDIAAAVSFSDQINDDKYSFHICAGLYGLAKRNEITHGGKAYTLDAAKSHVQLIASACQGMINALREAVRNNLITKFALQNARALEKPAAANPLLALRITQLVGSALNAISNVDDVKGAIENALPKLDSDKASSAVVATN